MYLCNRIKETKFFTPLAHWLLVLVLLIMWLVEVSPREWRRLFFLCSNLNTRYTELTRSENGTLYGNEEICKKVSGCLHPR